MTNEDKIKAIAELDGPEMYGVMKRGLWYRENAKGYTDDTNKAWHLTKEEAEKHNYPHDEPVRALLLPFRPYLTSYDAIIPVIEKIIINRDLLQKFYDNLGTHFPNSRFVDHWFECLTATPEQLSDALLKATGKWME